MTNTMTTTTNLKGILALARVMIPLLLLMVLCGNALLTKSIISSLQIEFAFISPPTSLPPLSAPTQRNNTKYIRSNRNRELRNATTNEIEVEQNVIEKDKRIQDLEAEVQLLKSGEGLETIVRNMAQQMLQEMLHKEGIGVNKRYTATPTTAPNLVPVIDYNYTFIRHHVDYKTKFPLPEWMEEFIATQPTGDPQKHHEMLTDPNNKFLVMTCYKYRGDIEESCGGLTDRLISLAYNMWVAHKTGRKLLIKYWKPRPLEEFLVPPPPSDHGFNWMLPDGYFMDEWNEYGNRTDKQYKDNRYWRPEIETLNTPEFSEKRVIFLNNNVLGREVIKKLADWDDDLWQGLFLRFFQPSREIAQRLNLITDPLQLEAGTYSAAHVRAKYPKRLTSQSGYLKYMDKKWYKADKTAARLDMTDNNTTRVVSELGNHAVTCAVRVMPDTKYVYVASDLQEIIEYVKTESHYWADDDTKKIAPTISWKAFDQTNETVVVSSAVHGWGVPSWEIPTTAKVIVRHDYNETADHFDNQRFSDPEPPSLMGSLVDYWMFAHAKGHSIGVGGFGRFGSVLAGNNRDTRSRHRDYDEVSPSCATSNERKAWKKLQKERKETQKKLLQTKRH